MFQMHRRCKQRNDENRTCNNTQIKTIVIIFSRYNCAPLLALFRRFFGNSSQRPHERAFLLVTRIESVDKVCLKNKTERRN